MAARIPASSVQPKGNRAAIQRQSRHRTAVPERSGSGRRCFDVLMLVPKHRMSDDRHRTDAADRGQPLSPNRWCVSALARTRRMFGAFVDEIATTPRSAAVWRIFGAGTSTAWLLPWKDPAWRSAPAKHGVDAPFRVMLRIGDASFAFLFGTMRLCTAQTASSDSVDFLMYSTERFHSHALPAQFKIASVALRVALIRARYAAATAKSAEIFVFCGIDFIDADDFDGLLAPVAAQQADGRAEKCLVGRFAQFGIDDDGGLKRWSGNGCGGRFRAYGVCRKDSRRFRCGPPLPAAGLTVWTIVRGVLSWPVDKARLSMPAIRRA